MHKIFPLSLILRLDAIFTLARHVQLKIMPIPLFKTKCYQILVSKPFTARASIVLDIKWEQFVLQNCEKLQNYRFKLGKKEQILTEVCVIKTTAPHSTDYLRRDEILGAHIRLLTRCKIFFTLGLWNYFSVKPLSLCLRFTRMCPKFNWLVNY